MIFISDEDGKDFMVHEGSVVITRQGTMWVIECLNDRVRLSNPRSGSTLWVKSDDLSVHDDLIHLRNGAGFV